MKRKLYILIIIFATILALTSIGFAAWGIINSQGKAEGDFTGYPIVDLNDAATSSISAFQYKETGFVGANQYSTSFSVTFELTQKDEAYNVSVELIDEDSFLSNVSSTYTYSGNTINGNKLISINNITSDRDITVTYTITTQSTDWSETGPVYLALDSGKYLYIKANATSSSGSWSIIKKIDLIATYQDFIQINIPDPDTTIFTYTGLQQIYNITTNAGYTVSNNTMTNAGTQTVTVSLNDGYQWNTGTFEDKEYTFTIEKASLSVSANTQTITYGSAPNHAGVQYSGFVNNETSSVLSGTLTYTYNYSQYENVGSYTITPSGLSSSNYNITFNGGTLTVAQKEIGITWGETTFTYDQSSHAPTATATGLVNNDVINITVTGAQVNAGTSYTATASSLTGTKAGNYRLPSSKTKTFKINKLGITASANDLSYNSSKRTWAQISPDIIVTLSGILDGDTVTSSVTGMHNGHFKFGTTDVTTYNGETLVTETNVVGSTYVLNVSLGGAQGGNYYIIEKPLFRYKTVISGTSTSKYYTIEEAILNTSDGITDISLAGDSSSTSSYVYTSFCALSGSDYPYNNGSKVYALSKNLYVPYNNSNTDKTLLSSNTSMKVYSALYISKGTVLNVNSKSIYVCSELGYVQSDATTKSYIRGVMLNDGVINLEGSAKIYAYGYIKSNYLNDDLYGIINLASGTTCTDCMSICSWPGGTAASAIVPNITSDGSNFLPINSWYLHNNSCKTVINSGATYASIINIVAGGSANQGNATIISNSSGSLFKLTSGKITKYVSNAEKWNSSSVGYLALFSITGNNQTFGIKDVIEIDGTCVDQSFSISAAGNSLSTSKDKVCPVTCMSIYLKNNASLSLTSASYLFLPGSSLNIENGSSLTIGSGCYVTFETLSKIKYVTDNSLGSSHTDYYTKCKDVVSSDAKCINNGTINCSGYFGGKIESSENGATFKTTNNSTSYELMSKTSSPYGYKAAKNYARGVFSSNENGVFNSNTQYTFDGNYWSGTFSTASDTNPVASAAPATCLLPTTLVTMADGSVKEIQYLVPGDMIMVFNHETGMLDVAPVTFNEFEELQWFNVIHLIFDNGSNVGVIYEHGFFDLDTMRYEYITEDSYLDFMGHKFYTIDGEYTTLVDAYISEEYTMCYSLPSYYHLNLFAEGLLSMPGGITGLFNYFEYADNLQYDQEKMAEDINTYGLFTVEEFEPYGVTEEMFYAYAGQYLKVALGKGILTEEYLMYLVERYGKYTE